MGQTQTPWNYINIIFAILLVLTLILLFTFSALQAVRGQTDTPSPDFNTEDYARQLEYIHSKEQDLSELEETLYEKEILLIEQQIKLKEQEDSLKNLVDVRTNIIKELVDNFSQSNLVLDIDTQTGAIRFSDGIFFDSGRDIITSNGVKYLEEFIPVYFSILLNENNRKYIAEIIIEGHTDNDGGYVFNLDLSQRRAFAVARFILERRIADFDNQDAIREYLTANGRSFSQPIMTGGVIDKKKSRRVEFKFRLKDEDTIKEMQKIFEGAN